MWYLLSIIIELLFCMYIDVFMLLISICFLLKDGLHERFEVYTLTVQQAVLNTYYFEFRIQIGHLSYAGEVLVVVLYLVFLRYTFMFKRHLSYHSPSLKISYQTLHWLSFSTCFAPPLFFIIGEFSLLIISLFSPFLSLQNYFDYRESLYWGWSDIECILFEHCLMCGFHCLLL